MRTTVELDDDLLEELQRRAQQEGVTLARLIARAVRQGLAAMGNSKGESKKPFRQRTYAMGKPKVSLEKALSLSAELEDEETIKKLTRKREGD